MSEEPPPPEWLPDGWIMKSKKRGNGKGDRYYTSPVTGYTFRSKVEVLRYLSAEKFAGQAPESSACLEVENQHVVEHAEDSPSWLPAGWILEIRTRKTGGKYKCYFDPSTSSRFYSKAELFRHLKAGKSSSPTPNKDSSDNVLAQIKSSPDGLPSGCIKEIDYRQKQNASGLRKDPSPIAAKKLKWHGSTVKQHLFSGQIPNSSGRIAEDISDSSVEEPCLLLSYRASPQCVEDPSPSCISDAQRQVETVQVASMLNPTCPSDGLSEKPKEPPELVNEKLSEPASGKLDKQAKGHETGSRQRGAIKAKGVKVMSLPRRASKRLAGLEADPTADIEISDMSLRTAKLYVLSKANSSKVALNRGASGGPQNLEAVSMQTPKSSVKLKVEELAKEQADLKEQHGAGNTADDKTESAMVLPFGDSWPDPCIEFAFKTLTGDIPVLEDTNILDYFHQQLSSPQTPSHPGPSAAYGSLNESKQLDILIHLESMGKHHLPPGNDRLPWSLNNELHSNGNVNKEPQEQKGEPLRASGER